MIAQDDVAQVWVEILAESGGFAAVVAGERSWNVTLFVEVADGTVAARSPRSAPEVPWRAAFDLRRRIARVAEARKRRARWPVDEPFVWAFGVVPDRVAIGARLGEAFPRFTGVRALFELRQTAGTEERGA